MSHTSAFTTMGMGGDDPSNPSSSPFVVPPLVPEAQDGEASVAVPMPSPCGKNALQFKGRDVEEFLAEFEHYAEMAQLTDERKCREVRLYFRKKEKRVLDVLQGYRVKSWTGLKDELRSLYTSSYEKRFYQPKDMQKFVAKERKITKLSHFDVYRQDFLVIASSLDERCALSEYNQDDYFWSGIKPASLRKSLERELKVSLSWVDLSCPPPLEEVLKAAQGHLKHDLYQVREYLPGGARAKTVKKRRGSDNDSEDELEGSDSSELESSSDEGEDESDTESDHKARKKKAKKLGEKLEVKGDEPSEVKGVLGTTPKGDLNVQSNIDDLTERF